MKFMLTFTVSPEHRDKALSRFKTTGGRPPNGTKLLGRWTAANLSGGFDLLECEDVKALAEFSSMWSDLMQLKVVPVIEDAALGEVLNRQKN